jgi:mono/diheme cytochrome c family protein
MNLRIFQTSLVSFLLTASSLACSRSAHAADDAASLYKAKCVACHAADGSGNTPTGKALGTLDLRSPEVQKQTDAQLIDATANGKGKKMPAYKGKLTDDQIKQLIGYIRELAKTK